MGKQGGHCQHQWARTCICWILRALPAQAGHWEEIVKETLTLPLGILHAVGNKIKELGHYTEKQGSRVERRGRLKMPRFHF